MSVDVILRDIKSNPQCPHGPTILFSRLVNTERRTFFACAACRDRKDCNFFMWEDELAKLSEYKKKIWQGEADKYRSGINHIKLFNTLNRIKTLPVNLRLYCRTCDGFQLPKFQDKHSDHEIGPVSEYDMAHPSEFLAPLDNAKKEAQFLFSKLAVDTIVQILRRMSIRNVLCIGTPRIHEYLTNEVDDMTSLLLDIDKRYHSFFGPLQFCWYNSFNHHFFLPGAEDVFKDFLQNDGGENFLLITDPPFGGRVEPLAHTFKHINALRKELNGTNDDLSVMWFFPYFMEPQILSSLPDFTMLDYKVDYDNHPLFQDGPKGRKQGSPVRIFTNVSPSSVVLPSEQGYKHCAKCDRWVAVENRHCAICGVCTSKDGRTYVHCSVCGRCVKPTWKHCDTCKRCAQVDHKCGPITTNKVCFHCKGEGHKKRDCVQVDRMELKRKRMNGIKTIKKRKKNKV